MDTHGNKLIVWISEVFLFQGEYIIYLLIALARGY